MSKFFRAGFISSSGARGTACLLTGLLIAGLAGTAPDAARAESPMHVDDASTLDRGRLEIETVYRRDGGRRLTEAFFSVGVLRSLELEISGGLGQDRDLSPRADLSGAGLGLKWVPIAQDLGWSLGARYNYGRLRIKPDAPGLRSTETDHALTGLATYRFSAGLAAHMNVGVQYGRADGDSETLGTWGLGVDWAVYGPLTVIAETYGLEGSSRRALGLRYTIREGLKASAAAGRGQGLSFGQVGVAWEF